MNQRQSDYSRVEVALKAALVISALGFVMLVADRSHVAPSETRSISAAPVAAEDNDATTRAYPEIAADAKDDEDGHPPSF